MTDKSIHPVVAEETELLEQIIRVLEENPKGFDNAEQGLIDQLILLRNEVLVAKEEDLPVLYNQTDRLMPL